MMAMPLVVSFSQNGEHLLHSSPDGVIKIWESATGVLKQEYTPSSHLSATCSCVSWSRKRHNTTQFKKKKKRKSVDPVETADVGDDLGLIALGTSSGTVLLYSFTRGDLHTQLNSGHTDTVTGISWHTSSPLTLYSSSYDQHVIEWDIKSGSVRQKWRADKGPVHSVCCCSKDHLLSAGHSIKLWDIHTRQVLKKYTGHATEVFRLLPLFTVDDGTTDGADSPSNNYFMSAALNDRILNAWSLNSSAKEKNSLASFSIPDDPMMLNIGQSTGLEQRLLVLTVTKNGQVLVFKHVLNGKLKKPVKPTWTIQVASACGKDDTPRPIPIVAACFLNDSLNTLLIAHGSFLKPTFESLVCDPSQSNICLVREFTHADSAMSKTAAAVTKLKTPNISKDLTCLVPGHMVPSAPSAPTQDAKTAASRRKRKSSVNEMSIEDRLGAIADIKTDGAAADAVSPPRADNLSVLLTQGLTSNDKSLLNIVLQHHDERIIRSTVQRLPIHVVIPLVKSLAEKLKGHANMGVILLKWLMMVMRIHTSYLLAFPDIVESLGALFQMVDSRVTMFGRLSQLHGKLDLLLSQISSQSEPEVTDMASLQPLLVYQDESSEEDIAMEDLLASHSESEDNWEDLSDMDTQEPPPDEASGSD